MNYAIQSIEQEIKDLKSLRERTVKQYKELKHLYDEALKDEVNISLKIKELNEAIEKLTGSNNE